MGGRMPKDFDKCVRGGGRVRTKKLKGDKYIHLCFDKSGSHAGHVKKKK
jgi:hypothetical protein